jgi:para-aminobenzoate synthetase component 1
MNKTQAIDQMNNYGKNKIPFLFIIDFEMLCPEVLPVNSINNNKIIFKINDTKNYSDEISLNKNLVFNKYPIAFDEYQKAFVKIMENIKSGNTYLLNLTFPTMIETNFTLRELFHYSTAKYKLYYDDRFVVFSPETFVKILNGIVYSYPMKGTINAEIENAAEIILNDDKETAEHSTIVDLIRNDLSIVAENVTVDEFRFIDRIVTHEKTLLQVSSKISGTLPDNYLENIGEIIFKLLPAGSITGAPKRKTVEIIKNVEITSRNYYTGIFGIFDGFNLDSSVMIRFIEKNRNKLFFKSGGGITYLSKAASEYQELIDKVYVPIG